MKKLYCYALCMILIFTTLAGADFTYVTADGSTDAKEWPSPPDVVAQTGIVMEAKTGTVLYNKNMNDKMYPASITKILTTLITLENTTPDEMINFYHYDVFSLVYGDAHIGMKENEQLKVTDCLYGVMLASANECANAAGEHIARKTKAFSDEIDRCKASGEEYNESKVALKVFADIMNRRAKKAGAINSHFNNPSGLFDEEHYTTCYDMAMITRDAIKNDSFLEIESNTTYRIPNTNLTAETRGVSNRHKMLYPDSRFYYEGAMGGKTGYVDQSGNTLVTFAKRNGITLICVIMKSNTANVYTDTALLLDYGFNNFHTENISDNEPVYSKSEDILSVDKDNYVIIPNNTKFADTKSDITFYGNTNKYNKIASIDYYYKDTHVGSTALRINAPDNASFKFGSVMKVKDKSTKTQHSEYFPNIIVWTLVTILLIILLSFILFVLYKRRKHFKQQNVLRQIGD